MPGAVLGPLAEVDGRDHRGTNRGRQLLDGAQGAAGAARLGGSDVADRDVVDAADAGPYAGAENALVVSSGLALWLVVVMARHHGIDSIERAVR